jgi:hypothetical protein
MPATFLFHGGQQASLIYHLDREAPGNWCSVAFWTRVLGLTCGFSTPLLTCLAARAEQRSSAPEMSVGRSCQELLAPALGLCTSPQGSCKQDLSWGVIPGGRGGTLWRAD